jgi:predicted metal-binding membrane protein
VLRRNPVPAAAGVAAVALVTWLVTIQRMDGMDAGPGTDLGGLGWFLGVWVTMMAAMMLPSVAPMALLFGKVSAERRRRGRTFVPLWVFLTGYLASWVAYGLAAYGVFRLLRGAHWHAFSWNAQGPLIAGAAIAAAGVYQLTPLKRVCLRHCRSPLHYVMGGWRPGRVGALRMGLEHGAFCVGCCWGLMLILFALGVMSITWMLVVAGLIFAEKVLPRGDRLTRVFAVAFIAVGIWVAAAPGSVPGLTQPTSTSAMSMHMSGGRSMHMSRGQSMHMSRGSSTPMPGKTGMHPVSPMPAMP